MIKNRFVLLQSVLLALFVATVLSCGGGDGSQSSNKESSPTPIAPEPPPVEEEVISVNPLDYEHPPPPECPDSDFGTITWHSYDDYFFLWSFSASNINEGRHVGENCPGWEISSYVNVWNEVSLRLKAVNNGVLLVWSDTGGATDRALEYIYVTHGWRGKTWTGFGIGDRIEDFLDFHYDFVMIADHYEVFRQYGNVTVWVDENNRIDGIAFPW
ncbi:MAG: hypothetical protein O2794_04275 [bacterium]|nr:hypothetical protein [bacterium]